MDRLTDDGPTLVQSKFNIPYIGLAARKPVVGVSNKARLKPVSSTTETSPKVEILLEASLDMILSNK